MCLTGQQGDFSARPQNLKLEFMEAPISDEGSRDDERVWSFVVEDW